MRHCASHEANAFDNVSERIGHALREEAHGDGLIRAHTNLVCIDRTDLLVAVVRLRRGLAETAEAPNQETNLRR